MFDSTSAVDTSLFNQGDAGLLPQAGGVTAADAGQGRALLFVDSRVAGYQSLVADANAEVILIDGSSSGLALISEALMGREDVSALHIVSHGGEGDLLLGQGSIDGDDLTAYSREIMGWAAALDADADILLYGCNVAGSTEGVEFVQRLGELSGADVAASDDLTGAAALGGDWDLEVETGSIESEMPWSQLAANSYVGTLGSNAFATRTELTGATITDVTGSNIGADSEAGEPAFEQFTTVNESVWWTWTAPSTGEVTIDASDSAISTIVAVFTGSAVDSLDLPPVGSGASGVTFQATAGTEYQIGIDGQGSAEGAIEFDLSLVPDNDDFANSLDLGSATGAINLNGLDSNVNATTETGESPSAPADNTVWYQWTAPSTGDFDITTLGSNFDTTLEVFTGTALNGLTSVDFNNDAGGGTTSALVLSAAQGTTYQIAVGGNGSTAEGTIDLNINLVVPNNPNPQPQPQPQSGVVGIGGRRPSLRRPTRRRPTASLLPELEPNTARRPSASSRPTRRRPSRRRLRRPGTPAPAVIAPVVPTLTLPPVPPLAGP